MGPTAAEVNRTPQDTERLYREHGVAVAAFCRSLLHDRGEAEDAAQQVFLSAHRALLNGAVPREPLAWLLAVARNECYARFRQRVVAPLPAADAPDRAAVDASTQALRASELARLWEEVERMPAAQREAFILREIRGLSYGQLADELSLSRPSVRSLLLRARTRLRRRLGDVAAGVGGAPWVQALLRLVSDGAGASPVRAATKAAAVGIGALALVGGGGPVARRAPRTPSHAGARHRAHAGVRRVAAPAPTATAADGDRTGADARGSRLERSAVPNDRSGESGSGRSDSPDGGGESGTSSGDGSSGSGHDGSGSGTTPTPVVQTPTGSDGGGSSSSGSGSGSGDGSTSDSGRDGGASGSGSGSDDGSPTTTTTTTTSSSGSDGSGTDGGSSGGHGG
jgi:RNA polymerase sigma factor (sigma-70 family)